MKLKEYLRTPKGKLVAAVCALACTWLILILVYAGDIFSSEKGIDPKEAQRQLAKLRAEEATLKVKLDAAQKIKNTYFERKKNSWNLQKDGEPEIYLAQKVEAAARKVQISLANFGSVRSNRINSEFFYAELDISGNAQYETILKFLAEIKTVQPQISWRRFSLFPNMRQFMRQNNSRTIISSASKQTTSEQMEFAVRGTLRVLVYDNMPKVTEGTKK